MKEDVEVVTAVAVEASAGSLDVICRSPEIAMQQEALKQGKRGQAESGFSKPCYGFWALRSAVREVVAEDVASCCGIETMEGQRTSMTVKLTRKMEKGIRLVLRYPQRTKMWHEMAGKQQSRRP